MDQKEFIRTITPPAIRASKGTNIFPSVIIARAIIEGGDGKGNYGDSILITQANNYFGITANQNYNGPKILVRTWEGKPINIYWDEKFLGEENGRYKYLRYFKKYDTPEDSFKSFVNLVSNGRYKEANQAGTAEEQAGIIARAGYATAKNAEELFTSITRKVQSGLSKVLEVVKENKFTFGFGTFAIITGAVLLIKSNGRK